MQKLFIIISLLGWLATAGVEAEEADFHALDAWLLKDMPETDDLGANLASITYEYHQLERGAQLAGVMLWELTKGHGNECTNGVMSALLHLKKTDLTMNGERRSERLLSEGWEDALEMCTDYIESKFKKSKADTLGFFRTFNANGTWQGPVGDDELYLGLAHLASRSPDHRLKFEQISDMPGKGIIGKDRVKFDRAFEKILVEPCEVINDKWLRKQMRALTLVDYEIYLTDLEQKEDDGEVKYYDDYEVDIQKQMEHMIWTRQLCTRIVNMNATDRTRVYDSVSRC